MAIKIAFDTGSGAASSFRNDGQNKFSAYATGGFVAAELSINEHTAELLVSSQSGELPVYTGAHEVIPATTAQTLATKEKIVKKDITVAKIPYYEVSNSADGKTAIIGG